MAKRSRRRDALGPVDRFAQRRVRYQRALEPLGLADAFARLPLRMREQFWQRKVPEVMIEFDHTFPEDRELRQVLDDGRRDATFDLDGSPMRVLDFLSVIMGCILVVENSPRAGHPEDVLEFFRVAQPRLRRCHDQHMLAAMKALYRAIFEPLMAHSRLDTRLLTAAWDFGTTRRGATFGRLVARAVEPQMRSVALDGEPRPMYRVPCTAVENVQWLSWTAEQVGRAVSADAPGEYPVFVQSHALRQMYKRVNLPAAGPYLDAWLSASLTEPNIVERLSGGNLLVEFRIHENRLGYFVVTLTQGIAAVRTFLFLTMEPSPESRHLRDRLRLTRREVDWLGLSDLAAFTQTDLRHDPVLHPLFEACGCGHLFNLNENAFAPEPKPFAAEMKRYLRLAG
jgi:hypothetical protein